MFIAYSLNQNIVLEKLAKDLGKLINDFSKTNPDLSNAILTIRISNISQETNELIPKLEHKNI